MYQIKSEYVRKPKLFSITQSKKQSSDIFYQLFFLVNHLSYITNLGLIPGNIMFRKCLEEKTIYKHISIVILTSILLKVIIFLFKFSFSKYLYFSIKQIVRLWQPILSKT